MKKRLLSIILAATMVLSMAVVGCGSNGGGSASKEGGKIFHIMAWNEEFKGFFEEYFAEKHDDGEFYVGDAKVKWTIVPNEGGAYQDALDRALLNQENASEEDRVDMFLAEADYIAKYVQSDATTDVTKIGVTDFSNAYKYTVEAASDEKGVVKGVSFQCCPAGVIYRRSIAIDLFGTDDPAEVQSKIDSWDKFDEVAALCKSKGYYMTASDGETFRTFSNNRTEPWVDADGNLVIDSAIQAWMDQSENYTNNEYTIVNDIWGEEKQLQMLDTGKTFAFFGPAWYYNFCMGNAMDTCKGDWALCEGPQSFFWGGTWLLAATGTDNAKEVADTMNTFLNDEDVASKLVSEKQQFVNNQKVNEKFASDPTYGNEFLGGQNDTALFVELAKNIKFQNTSKYDQLCNEGIQQYWREYLKGEVTKEQALDNFRKYIKEKYPNVNTDK
ncbi:MAG: carbohydrate ABC transporter substrate-binding protein [Lachnospiraceae bacterium]|nr:carbohydrate ABC transporter substrate-binding protein [Lachnospiraceae bacterium]MBO4461788.1 carbohydrate ABC transporter substrate-binding protein [Lachnospiraceae bacterium]